jgi:hypothetical protein
MFLATRARRSVHLDELINRYRQTAADYSARLMCLLTVLCLQRFTKSLALIFLSFYYENDGVTKIE